MNKGEKNSRLLAGVKLEPAFSLLFDIRGQSKAKILPFWINKYGFGESRSRSSRRPNVTGRAKKKAIILLSKIFFPNAFFCQTRGSSLTSNFQFVEC